VERVLFDGACGFCRGWARWIAEQDPGGALFRLEPLGGRRDTVVVETEDGRTLLRSDAVIHVLRRVGRRRSAAALALLPRPVRDLGYRLFARALRRNPETRGPRGAP
jgi:predicted DCC family thiol-disulfide oxidoreductase YuxK